MAYTDRETLKRTFDRDAELYDKARPAYPEQVFSDLLNLAALRPDAALFRNAVRYCLADTGDFRRVIFRKHFSDMATTRPVAPARNRGLRETDSG